MKVEDLTPDQAVALFKVSEFLRESAGASEAMPLDVTLQIVECMRPAVERLAQWLNENQSLIRTAIESGRYYNGEYKN